MTAAPTSRAQRRRVWWTAAFLGLLGLGVAAVVASLFVFAWPTDAAPAELRVDIQSWQVPAAGDDPVPFREGRFWLVHLSPSENAPQNVTGGSAPPAGGLIALYWRDPHLGCTVPWRPNFEFQGSVGWFRNPCHGETYSKAGLRAFGPTPRSLDTMEVRVNDDGSVRVFPERITLGGSDNASRAVPYPDG
jgi:cytochrome b6-f complex iron-sulfur subunit